MRPLALALIALTLALPAAPQAPITPDAAVMRLDEVGLYRVGYAYRGQPERLFPDGWSGDFEERTGIACRPAGQQGGKQAFLLHCPWRGGTGVTFQQFVFRLPAARRIVLRGATAMRSDVVGKSDGATFRIYVNGQRRLDINRADAQWRPFALDLTALAGATAAIRFETDPGPADNPSFDFSLWGDRELVLDGFRPAAAPHPARPALDLRRLLPAQTGTAAPPSGFPGRVRVTGGSDGVTFHYEGADGTIEYRWQAPQSPEDGLFGRVVLHAQGTGDRRYSVRVGDAARVEWAQAATPAGSRWETVPNGRALIRTFQVGDTKASVRITGHMAGKSLVLDVTCDQPLATGLDGGGWGPVLRRRPVTVPYYTGQVQYLPAEDLFVNSALDWTSSNATWMDGSRASYGSLTDGTRNPLRERVILAAAWHLAEALPNIPNPPSPFIKQIGDRIVLDTWGGRYADIARGFETLHGYGITNCTALIHVWQRSGYDNALPAHVPAMAELGGDPAMREMVQAGVRLDYLVAPHENYVDYYPNYDLFDPNDIALDGLGNRQLAWYNPGTKIQSFAVKPNAILRLAATQSPEIHRRYGTNADYLDVHSAVPPWFHVDMRAGEEGAGRFDRVWNVHRELWAYERTTHGGPVFGEGNNHWYWSGLLDGVEAQFGSGWPANQGMSAPLAVDFDLLKIHPLQLNHGMGYYERWWSDPQWGRAAPMVVLDQYRMQEVAYGHAGFLAGSVWNNVPTAWLEHHLLSPVMARYATARPASIEYQVNGAWVDGSAAAKAGDWRRPRVTYDNGLTITANDAQQALAAGGVTLPRFGWVARGAGVTAWTALKDGAYADYAETATSVFANARSAADWSASDTRRVRPEVTGFAQTGPRTFTATYRWTVGERLPEDYHCFVHFVDPRAADEGIRFQQDHALGAPTSQWRPGSVVADGPYTIRVPDDVPDGDYRWTIGLYAEGGGARVGLEGLDDGHGRIVLGTIHVRDQGRALTLEPPSRSADERQAWYRRNLNSPGKVVDFGTVRTDGSVLVRREGSDWVLRPLARGRQFTVQLLAARYGRPSRVRCIGGRAPTLVPRPRGPVWALPLSGAREYRWQAGAAHRST